MPYHKGYPVHRNRVTQRRRTEWATTSFALNAVVSNGLAATDLLQNFVSDGGSREGLTILRTHIVGGFAAASVGGQARVGLIVAGLNVSQAANGELDPRANPYEPWLLDNVVFPTTSGATVDASTPFRYDIRSKRKVQHVQETYWLSFSPTDSGTTSLAGLVRCLVALP